MCLTCSVLFEREHHTQALVLPFVVTSSGSYGRQMWAYNGARPAVHAVYHILVDTMRNIS